MSVVNEACNADMEPGDEEDHLPDGWDSITRTLKRA